MGSPIEYLPAPWGSSQILDFLQASSFPTPESIAELKGSGQFHIIYILTYSAYSASGWLSSKGIELASSDTFELILRISGDHFPAIKTKNEVAILSWVYQNTTIPVPRVVTFDATTNNLLKAEYILFTKVDGICLADVYSLFSSEKKDAIVDQIVDIQQQLHKNPGKHIGGLRFLDSETAPGPVVSEDHWFAPEIRKYFEGEQFENINAVGPFDTYVDYVTANIRTYIHVIKLHPSLHFMTDVLPRLELFLSRLVENTAQLNKTRLCLAHKDLHFGNMLVDPETARITAVLDWEFSGFVPYQRFDPHNGFLWTGQSTDSAKAEQRRLQASFRQRAKQNGLDHLVDDAKYTSTEQEHMQTVMDYCRAIVEVSPRHQQQEFVARWKKSMLDALSVFGM